jgi:hypothetical protein
MSAQNKSGIANQIERADSQRPLLIAQGTPAHIHMCCQETQLLVRGFEIERDRTCAVNRGTAYHTPTAAISCMDCPRNAPH